MANMATLLAAIIGIIICPLGIIGLIIRFIILIMVAPAAWLICLLVGIAHELKAKHRTGNNSCVFR